MTQQLPYAAGADSVAALAWLGQPDNIKGLQKKSVVDCFQLRAISHNRFMERIGAILENEIDLIKKAIALILDIHAEQCE